LSREFEATQIDELRGQLAVHIAAHGAEAEDNTTVERMLTMAALEAEMHGASDIASYINVEVLPIYAGALYGSQVDEKAAGTGADLGDQSDVDTSARSHQPLAVVIRNISDAIIQGRSSEARTTAIRTLETHGGLSRHERILLTCLASRACINLGMLDDAESLMRPIVSLSDISPADQCYMKNVEGAVALARGNADAAAEHFHEAARLAEHLPANMRVMTLGNIIIHLRSADDKTVDRYENSVRRLASTHGWPGVRADLGL
ncbi:MAG: hypothetical protein NTX15_07615, partial [Candidatus Kapabacteria bacterium]|nr:hypothetical protein [Candidatus Kapabacteria bacterium]